MEAKLSVLNENYREEISRRSATVSPNFIVLYENNTNIEGIEMGDYGTIEDAKKMCNKGMYPSLDDSSEIDINIDADVEHEQLTLPTKVENLYPSL